MFRPTFFPLPERYRGNGMQMACKWRIDKSEMEDSRNVVQPSKLINNKRRNWCEKWNHFKQNNPLHAAAVSFPPFAGITNQIFEIKAGVIYNGSFSIRARACMCVSFSPVLNGWLCRGVYLRSVLIKWTRLHVNVFIFLFHFVVFAHCFRPFTNKITYNNFFSLFSFRCPHFFLGPGSIRFTRTFLSYSFATTTANLYNVHSRKSQSTGNDVENEIYFVNTTD